MTSICDAQLKLSLKKCTLFQKEVHIRYLGRMVLTVNVKYGL